MSKLKHQILNNVKIKKNTYKNENYSKYQYKIDPNNRFITVSSGYNSTTSLNKKQNKLVYIKLNNIINTWILDAGNKIITYLPKNYEASDFIDSEIIIKNNEPINIVFDMYSTNKQTVSVGILGYYINSKNDTVCNQVIASFGQIPSYDPTKKWYLVHIYPELNTKLITDHHLDLNSQMWQLPISISTNLSKKEYLPIYEYLQNLLHSIIVQ